MGLTYLRHEKFKIHCFPEIILCILFSIISVALEPRLLADEQAEAKVEASNNETFQPQWQNYIRSKLASSSKGGEAFAILTTAGWVDMGQLFWIIQAGDEKTDVYRIHPGVRLSRFEDSLKIDNPKSHSVLQNIDLDALPDVESLLKSKSHKTAGLDHVRFLVLHYTKQKNSIETKSVLFDSPMIEKECPDCMKKLEKIYQWVDSNIKGQKK